MRSAKPNEHTTAEPVQLSCLSRVDQKAPKAISANEMLARVIPRHVDCQARPAILFITRHDQNMPMAPMKG